MNTKYLKALKEFSLPHDNRYHNKYFSKIVYRRNIFKTTLFINKVCFCFASDVKINKTRS